MIFSLIQSGPAVALAFVLALVVAITVHEFAHALAGYLQGDMTARDEGRLTLNPLAHLDFMGSLMLLFAGFGWGRPTPYNPYNLVFKRAGPALVALAGPISNITVVIAGVLALSIFAPGLGPENFLVLFLQLLVGVNMMLAIFNLIPIPPLDGSQILFTFLPPRYDRLKFTLMRNGPMLLLGLIILDNFVGINIFGSIFNFFFSLLGRFV